MRVAARTRSFLILGVTILALLTLSACRRAPVETPTETPPEPTAAESDTDTAVPTDMPAAEEPSEEAPAPPVEPAGAERQLLNFTTGDGRSLEGYYYPAATLDAPIIVLMHWAPGTMEDWHEIALWLQNRGSESTSVEESLDAMVSFSNQASEPWNDPTWFPVLPAEVSFAVFTFNFGGRGSSQEGLGQEGLFQDALAALSAAASLPGVDRNRITAAGASIGADASVNSCQAFNAMEAAMGTCLGAFSISPGNYLGRDYGQIVGLLRSENPPKSVACAAAAGDGNALATCLSGAGPNFTSTAYEGGDHGMRLVRPDLSPNPLTLLVQFLETVYGITLIGT